MSSNITIMALGGAGCRIIKEFSALEPAGDFRLLAMDSDLESLKNSGLPENNWIQAGKLLRSGRGCGGDVIAGQQAVANERKTLAAVLADTKVLITVAGLGGGFASGGLSVVLGVAAKLHITTAVLAALPFSLEGFQRRHLADEKIKKDILPIADAVIALPNDLLFSTLKAETPIAEAFRLSDVEFARALLSVASVFGGGNLFNADFASFTGVLKRKHTLCSLGTVLVDNGPEAAGNAMEKMLQSPLLGGPETLDNADALAFSLLGGEELSMGSAKEVLELCARQIAADSEKNILLGAGTAESMTGKLQLTVLAVRYLERGDSAEISRKRSLKSGRIQVSADEDGLQMDLPNLTVENKGIMENTMPVMLEGEDLDVPAFRRKGIVIDTGK